MSEAESLVKLEQWFDRLNEIESVDNPDARLVNEMLDMLGPLIVLLAFDFERHGLDATEVKVAALKHKSHQNRHVERRLEVIDSVSILCGRLLGAIEQDKPAKPENEPIAKPVDPDDDDDDIEARALDCLTSRQQKIVIYLLTRKHTTTADTLKNVDDAFQYGDHTADRAVTAAVERINERWLKSGIPWVIQVQDAKGSPRFKLEK